MEEHELWRTARGELERGLGAATFQRWIAPLHFTGLCDQGVARLRADSKFHADWAARHYAEKVASAFADAGAKIERVSIEGPGAPGRGGAHADDGEGVGDGLRQGTAEETALARAPAAGHDGLRSSKLDPRCTFETFVVGKPNELAHAAARRVSESAGADYNPVFLHGGVGLGKTHLMHAIAWRLRRTRPNASVLYLSAEQFMYRFVQALRQRDTISFKQEFRAVDVLMVDDIQFIADKNSTQEEFFHTFNSLIDEGRQIVLSGDRAPGDIEGLSERITSRLQWGLVVDIHPTNYELRLGILQAKAEVALSRNPGLSISPKVLEFLAHRISANVRVLEGALTRLVANATLIGKPVDLDMAHQHLGDLLRQTDKKVTIEEIMRKVAEHFNLRMSDMTSARRARAVARPRQIAMYLSKTLTPRSLPDIGKRFGGRDHTTVMHAIRKVEELMAADAQIAEDVELLRRMLEA